MKDDFGSGYSSLDVLQSIHFDLIKLDMRFMQQFDNSEESRIILTELARMAAGLGVETVCEGVERPEQIEFLREIGCTKAQGFHYGKPTPFSTLLEWFQSGKNLRFENPKESEYFITLGRINLYDMAAIASVGDDSLREYFDTLPMAVMEVNGSMARYTRCNKSYRDFMKSLFGIDVTGMELDSAGLPGGRGSAFMSAVLRCSRDGNRAVVDEPIDEKTTVHTFIRRVAVNPVTGTAAIAIAVLSVMEEKGSPAPASRTSRGRCPRTTSISIMWIWIPSGSLNTRPMPVRRTWRWNGGGPISSAPAQRTRSCLSTRRTGIISSNPSPGKTSRAWWTSTAPSR